ncbi:MAG: peptidyl-prolyl cis-trans isomerase [Ignavibacteria bacterium]|nr:peptidyl-prolyl cis-trans isomerase [Ignavibacteria bacterium]
METAPKVQPPPSPVVVMETSMGTVEIELYPEHAPKTVANFLSYVNEKYFDGTIFHRVINNFMIQGGGFTKDFKEKETKPSVENEADNGLKNEVGTIAMARTNEPHSATSQFFINVKDNAFLNFSAKTPQGWGYCVFGKVTSGMEAVNKIKAVKTGTKQFETHGQKVPFQDVPTQEVVIKSVRLKEQNQKKEKE